MNCVHIVYVDVCGESDERNSVLAAITAGHSTVLHVGLVQNDT